MPREGEAQAALRYLLHREKTGNAKAFYTLALFIMPKFGVASGIWPSPGIPSSGSLLFLWGGS